MKTAYFERFTLEIEKEDAELCSHPGPCDDDVAALLEMPYIQKQLDTIPAQKIREELAEYGAWDETELQNIKDNHSRIVWIAAGNIIEEDTK